MPLTAALWSTAPGRALEFPAATAIRFFENHGMLGFGRFRWRYVTGGSDAYVRTLGERLGASLHVGLGARALRRSPDGVELTTEDGETRRFDAAVIATHADQALGLLADPSEDESRVLGAFAYTRNDVVLPTDLVVRAKDLSDEKHDDEEQEAGDREGRVDEHEELTLHPAIPDCQRYRRSPVRQATVGIIPAMVIWRGAGACRR